MYRLKGLSMKCMKSLPLVMAPICGHYMSEHIRHNDTITTKSDPNFTIKSLIALRNARLANTDVAAKMRKVYYKCRESIVLIRTPDGNGTGFLVTASGLIVANCHVVKDHPYVAVMLWEPGSRAELIPNEPQSTEYVDELDGQVVYAEPALDLALVRVFVNEHSLPALTLSTRTEREITVGEPVLALGFPNVNFSTALGWVLCAEHSHPQYACPHYNYAQGLYLNETDVRFLYSSLATVPGFSGGPVLDGNGLVIGVTVSVGLYDSFAVNITALNVFVNNGKDFIAKCLADKREYERAGKRSLGVVLRHLRGARVFVVNSIDINRWPNVLDETKRLVVRDIITHINGKRLESFAQLDETLQTLPVGDPLKLKVDRREGNKGVMDVEVKPLTGEHPICSAL